MSLDQKVLDAVDKAFMAAGDVKVGVSLSGESVSGFNHETQEVIEGSSIPTVVVLGIQLKRKVKRDGVEEVTYLFKYSDVDIESYQTITDHNGTYKIVEHDAVMTYLVEVKATKEN